MASVPHPASAVRAAPDARALPGGWGVVRRRVRRRVPRLTIVSAALLAVAGVGLFQVLQTTRVTAVGYEVRALELERQELDADVRLLEAQIAESSNLERLRAQATTRLRMVPAQLRIPVTVEVAAPAVVPLPRRYVPARQHGAPPQGAWWEDLLGTVPGLR